MSLGMTLLATSLGILVSVMGIGGLIVIINAALDGEWLLFTGLTTVYVVGALALAGVLLEMSA